MHDAHFKKEAENSNELTQGRIQGMLYCIQIAEGFENAATTKKERASLGKLIHQLKNDLPKGKA